MAQVDLNHFRENLRFLTAERGACRRLAEAVGIHPPHLSDILRGIKTPGLDLAYDLARESGYGLDELGMPPKKFQKLFKKAG